MSLMALCKKHGYSFRRLSKEEGVSFTYLSRLNTGIYKNPSLQILTKIARRLGVSIEEVAKAIMEED
ncbi:helix-turn-helix domain-containing protein [Clostridium kluyveri]|uniref:HTH cro/C1-type domain-containing protein n=1 Tax=Clostridium kluyveri TaxID=1534 RepID=A0A1L5F8Y1_CLOKL|nr:helix-turn-helix transcriptional regulator [Clostridium kluyveri]APM39442.1 hypothetical protein BS101_12150 [Clostridium kluyveri]